MTPNKLLHVTHWLTVDKNCDRLVTMCLWVWSQCGYQLLREHCSPKSPLSPLFKRAATHDALSELPRVPFHAQLHSSSRRSQLQSSESNWTSPHRCFECRNNSCSSAVPNWFRTWWTLWTFGQSKHLEYFHEPTVISLMSYTNKKPNFNSNEISFDALLYVFYIIVFFVFLCCRWTTK